MNISTKLVVGSISFSSIVAIAFIYILFGVQSTSDISLEQQEFVNQQVKAIKEGLCDISLGNSYYLGKMLQDPKQIEWANAVNLNFPNQQDRGSHINVSGAIMAKHAPHKEAAQKLIEFLTSQQTQSLYAELNMEYPVMPAAKVSDLVSSWGTFKADPLPLEEIAKYQKQALKLVDKVRFDL